MKEIPTWRFAAPEKGLTIQQDVVNFVRVMRKLFGPVVNEFLPKRKQLRDIVMAGEFYIGRVIPVQELPQALFKRLPFTDIRVDVRIRRKARDLGLIDVNDPTKGNQIEYDGYSFDLNVKEFDSTIFDRLLSRRFQNSAKKLRIKARRGDLDLDADPDYPVTLVSGAGARPLTPDRLFPVWEAPEIVLDPPQP